MMNKSDIDWALHQIEQMVIIARRSTRDLKPSKDPAYRLLPVGEHESLEFSLGDILDKVTALKDDLAAERPATAAPDAGSGGQRPDTTVKPEGDRGDWRYAYSGLEGPLCKAVNMLRIANGLANEVDRDDQIAMEEFTFAVDHARDLLEDLRRGYYEGYGERQS
jgi:hypothetical protein